MKQGKSTAASKLMYGCGDIFGGGAFLLISLLYLNYLTDVELIAPALAGTIIMIGKVWDAVWDPLMGVISDNTKSKLGRRRLYFVLGVVPIFITFSLMWYSFGISSEVGKFVYYLVMYILFNMTFSMVMIPYNSILPEMTKDYNERTSFTGVRMIFSVASAILAGVFPKIIVNTFGSSIQQGYLIMAMIFAAIYAIPWLIVFKGTWENHEKSEDKKEKILKELTSVFRNRSFRIHAGMFLTGQAAVDILTTLFIYYLTVCIEKPGQFSAVLGALLVTQLISMPIHTKISRKYNKTRPLKIGMGIWMAALAGSLFLTQNSPTYLVYMVAAFSGLGTSAAVLVPWSILPEVADVDELITSKRREGVYSGMVTFLRKSANGFTIGLIGIVLQWIGYIQPKKAGEAVVQAGSTVLGIKLLFGIAPIIFMVTAVLISNRYSMTEEKYKILAAEIDRRREGGSAQDMDENTASVCEELTGISKVNFWNSQIGSMPL